MFHLQQMQYVNFIQFNCVVVQAAAENIMLQSCECCHQGPTSCQVPFDASFDVSGHVKLLHQLSVTTVTQLRRSQ